MPVHRTAVSRWIDNWNEFGCKGLKDEEKPGRPPILSVEEEEKAFEIAMKNPKFPHHQISEISRETGKTIGQETLKRLIKKDYRWNRVKSGLWQQTNEDKIRICPAGFDRVDEKS